MVNRVTKAERERIYRRAKQLRLSGVASMNELTNVLMDEFNISRERARSAAGKVLRRERWHVIQARK
jgi:hypothetical protein